MKDKSQTDKLIAGFLLGESPEAEREALEERFVSDAEFFERICEVENRLVDDYARERLSRKEREQFERGYLTTAARRQKVAFARSLARAAAQGQAWAREKAAEQQAAEQSVPWWQALFANLRASSLVPRLSLAMALVLLVGGVWAGFQILSLRRELRAASQERDRLEERRLELDRRIQDLERQVAAGGAQNDELAKELERLRRQQQELERQQPQRQTPEAPSIASFLLLPGSVRGGGGSQTLTMADAVGVVQLQVQFDKSEYASYGAIVRTVDGRQVFQQTGLKPRPLKTGVGVSLRLPATRLPRNDYILILYGVLASGETEEVERYFFRVEKK